MNINLIKAEKFANQLTNMKDGDLYAYVYPNIPKDVERYMDICKYEKGIKIRHKDILCFVEYYPLEDEEEFSGFFITKDLFFRRFDNTIELIDFQREFITDVFSWNGIVQITTREDASGNYLGHYIHFPTLKYIESKQLESLLYEILNQIHRGINSGISEKISQEEICKLSIDIFDKYQSYSLLSDYITQLTHHRRITELGDFSEDEVEMLASSILDLLSAPFPIFIHSWKYLVKGTEFSKFESFFTAVYNQCLDFVSNALDLHPSYLNRYRIKKCSDEEKLKLIQYILTLSRNFVPVITDPDEIKQAIIEFQNKEKEPLKIELIRGQKPVTTDKNSNKILNFIDDNATPIFNALKKSGLSLTAAALQNDENIAKVAGVIHGLLPMPVRIFVNLAKVEEFLMENRYWLIEKLS